MPPSSSFSSSGIDAASTPTSLSTNSGPSLQQQLPPIRQVAPSSQSPRAKDKVVIITGANSTLGIGRASAHQFAQNGARAVYICDYADENLQAHAQEIKSLYPDVEVHARRFDAADANGVKSVVDEALASYGRLDVFFANAGVLGTPLVFANIDGEDFMRTLRTNVLSVFLAIKEGSRAMRVTDQQNKTRSAGSIIATASVAGLRSNAGSSDYSASKAAVINLVQTAAYQLVGTGVRVNAICPGMVETGMTKMVYDGARKKGTEGKIGQLNPLRRGAVADEIARVALFLGSDEASYVNGQAWAVDGGLSAGMPFVPGKLA